MPSYIRHDEQYRHNKKILNDISALSCNDWKVTIVFYCAVHKIEKFLSKVGPSGIHNSSHKARHKNVTNIAALKSIANQYQVLYMLSIKSRYNCLTIKNDELNKALDMLSIIENAIP